MNMNDEKQKKQGEDENCKTTKRKRTKQRKIKQTRGREKKRRMAM